MAGIVGREIKAERTLSASVAFNAEKAVIQALDFHAASIPIGFVHLVAGLAGSLIVGHTDCASIQSAGIVCRDLHTVLSHEGIGHVSLITDITEVLV